MTTETDIPAGIDEVLADEAAALKLEQAPTALCLSGGGIRSAIFWLGVSAHARMLEHFDYLSTVSGGGFVGAWLSTWIHRQGGAAVVSRSLDADDPPPLQYLRAHSQYLKVGPSSAAPTIPALIGLYAQRIALRQYLTILLTEPT
jgi:hypothetical protein